MSKSVINAYRDLLRTVFHSIVFREILKIACLHAYNIVYLKHCRNDEHTKSKLLHTRIGRMFIV